MTRVLKTAALCTVLVLGCARAGETKPNILIILSDDQGYADVSFNPHHPKEVATPHTDALAKSGIVFSNGYVMGNVCSPSRTALMTGRYPQRMGIYTGGEGGSGVPLDEVMFPMHLKKAGYVSAAFGKWHMGLTPEYNPVKRGFDEFYGFMGRGAHSYFKLKRGEIGFKGDKENPLYRNLEPIDDEGYLTTRIAQEAVAFIERNKERPFFAYVAFNALHAPAEAPEEDIRSFDTGDADRNVLMAMLKHLDAGVGAMVAKLKERGLYENTLIVYLTDNGGSPGMKACNAPLRGHKHQNYEGGIRVPFAISWPAQVQGGRTCDAPVSSLDVLPTVLDLLKLEPASSKPLDGRSILPLLRGEALAPRAPLFWNSGDGSWAVRAGDWKLFGERAKIELYNLQDDIAEAKDLAAAQPDRVRELKAAYDAWVTQMAEPAHKETIKVWDPASSPGVEKKAKKKKAAADE